MDAISHRGIERCGVLGVDVLARFCREVCDRGLVRCGAPPPPFAYQGSWASRVSRRYLSSFVVDDVVYFCSSSRPRNRASGACWSTKRGGNRRQRIRDAPALPGSGPSCVEVLPLLCRFGSFAGQEKTGLPTNRSFVRRGMSESHFMTVKLNLR